ncbi:MAG: RNA 2',3'-cyclic phosphodiesterase [Candidatus Moranbacteria bacterium]|nr:RNA 2',3'-cyclic phosphodiesterase [Candidatus Moranbacteria bacterium]
MQKKKIFIEIQIPDQVKRRLAKTTEKWNDLPIKWSKQANLHITLSFIGYVDESVIPEICFKTSEAVANVEAFDLEMDKITFYPDPQHPKTILVTGQADEELKNLHESVQRSLGMGVQSFKQFKPHITLGKIREEKWEALEEKPQIDEQVKIVVPVEYVSVMESKGGGAEYVSLEDCPLG